MNKTQLQELVIEPTLMDIPAGYSREAVLMAMMCAAHESLRGQYLKQVGGPALGIYGIEPDTYYDTWKHGDSIRKNAVIVGILKHEDDEPPEPEQMMYDLRLATFMFRQRLFMKTEPLPKLSSFISREQWLAEASLYLKEHWNSIHGAAEEMSYKSDYIRWV